MRKYLLFLLALVSCSKIKEVKEYLPIEPKFVLTGDVKTLAVGDKLIISSKGKDYTYQVKSIGSQCELEAASEKDKIFITKEDKSFSYSIVYPSLEPEVPSVQDENTVIPTAIFGKIDTKKSYDKFIVDMKQSPRSTILELEFPQSLLASKTLSISYIEILGIRYNFNKPLVLDSDKIVKVAVNPFIIPESGLKMSIITTDKEEFISTLLSGSEDANLKFEMGSVYRVYVPIIDEFKPCTFPVVFPLGKNPNARTGYYNYSDDQSDWLTRGIWYCFDQKQVMAKWHKASEPNPSYFYVRELLNTRDIGSIGMKGIWTGDYFEFAFPVEKIEAGTTINFKAPFYGRNQPIFWTIEWLEDGQWVNADKPVTSWDGSTTLDASFATKLYGVVIDYSFTVNTSISNDYLRVRLKCTDGSYQADHKTEKVIKRDLPYIENGIYFSPFYFYCENSGVNAMTWSIK